MLKALAIVFHVIAAGAWEQSAALSFGPNGNDYHLDCSVKFGDAAIGDELGGSGCSVVMAPAPPPPSCQAQGVTPAAEHFRLEKACLNTIFGSGFADTSSEVKTATVRRADGSEVGSWAVKIWCASAGSQTYDGGDSNSCHGRLHHGWYKGDVLFL